MSCSVYSLSSPQALSENAIGTGMFAARGTPPASSQKYQLFVDKLAAAFASRCGRSGMVRSANSMLGQRCVMCATSCDACIGRLPVYASVGTVTTQSIDFHDSP